MAYNNYNFKLAAIFFMFNLFSDQLKRLTIDDSGGNTGVRGRVRIAVPRWRDLLHGALRTSVVEDLLGATEDGIERRRIRLRCSESGVAGRRVVVRRGAWLGFVVLVIGVLRPVDGRHVLCPLLSQRFLVFSTTIAKCAFINIFCYFIYIASSIIICLLFSTNRKFYFIKIALI